MTQATQVANPGSWLDQLGLGGGVASAVGAGISLVDSFIYTDQEKTRDQNAALAAQAQIETAKAAQAEAAAKAQGAQRLGLLVLGGLALFAGAWVVSSALKGS